MAGSQRVALWQTGFTYMGILFAVALLGSSLALIGSTWKVSQQRENEKELLFVGDQFRKAIALYYERTPGSVKQFPKSFDQLIKDNRYIVPQRYLRKVFRDPITNQKDWGVINSPDGGIMGVYSLSDKPPRKQANFKEPYNNFESAKRYSDWKFIYKPNIQLTIPVPKSPINR